MYRYLWAAATIITLYATIYHSISPASQVPYTVAVISLCFRTTVNFLDPRALLISRLTSYWFNSGTQIATFSAPPGTAADLGLIISGMPIRPGVS